MSAPVQLTRVLSFDLGGEMFAIPADTVREILEVPPVTRVPGAPDFSNGLINVRG
ncbi:chemotaxis protein CheW, partial [Escherichia coli]